MKYQVPEEFILVASAAVMRLNARTHKVQFDLSGNEISVESADDNILLDDIRTMIADTLYREKIYQETLSIRERLYNG